MWVTLWHIWGFAGRPTYEYQLLGPHLDFTPLIRSGWAGVDMFFVLSGFVLGLPFCQAYQGQRSPIRIPEYFRRRLLRVLPAYYIQLIILASLIAVTGGIAALDTGALIAQFLMLQNVLSDPGSQLNPVYWTLPIEFNFYILLPLLAFWVPPQSWPVLLVASVFIVVLYRYLVFWNYLTDSTVQQRVWVLNQLPGRLDQFVAGMVAAWWYLRIRTDEPDSGGITRYKSLLLILALIAMGAMTWFIHNLQPMHTDNILGQTFWAGHWSLYIWHTLFGIFLALMIFVIALGNRIATVLLSNKPVMYLGIISYSIYLWHFPVVKWITRASLPSLTPGYPYLNLLLWTMVPILLVSSLSFWLVEKPFLKLRHRI